MLSYLLGILIIIFFLITLIKTSSATCEGFVYEFENTSKAGNKDETQSLHEENKNGSGNSTLNVNGNDLLVQSKRKNQTSISTMPIISPTNNINLLTNMNQQMNNINSQINNNLNLQNERPQKNLKMTQESRQETAQELEPRMNKIRFQTPVRLEMELPYEQSSSEDKKYSNDMIQTPADKNISTHLENIIKKGDVNIKIKNIIKKAAQLSFLALDNSKEPVYSLKSSNYAIAYVSVLQEIYTDDQIQNATNINLNQFKNELLKIQSTITANIKNTCLSLETDKQYLLKIINNI